MFAGTLAVFFNTAIQHKVGILHRLVVDEPVQLGAVKAVVRYLVLYGDTVDGNHAAVCKKQLHAGRVDIELAGNKFAHVENLRAFHLIFSKKTL